MIRASYISHPLIFIRPAGTSRGVLDQKPCWFIRLTDEEQGCGVGEVSVIPGLSLEDPDECEIQIDHICKLINRGEMDPRQKLPAMPGVQFALESALRDLENGGKRLLYPSDFTRGRQGIPTNGLIWMGSKEFMISQIREKLSLNFRVLKLKVGALDIKDELEILQWIRTEFGKADLELRLDANGAWRPEEAALRMEQFAAFDIHSIEQPIAPGQSQALAQLCRKAAIPVALDEELIGISELSRRRDLLEEVRPAYLILKPGLLGGISESLAWIRLAREKGVDWWITSALESNIGLNAIAQWTYSLRVSFPQGLGTGALYTNNIPSPLKMQGERLWYRPRARWGIRTLIR